MTQTPNQQPSDENQQDGDRQDQQRVVVVTQDGMGVAPHSDDEDDCGADRPPCRDRRGGPHAAGRDPPPLDQGARGRPGA